ncbi:leucine-rich repeat domain-containing protein [Lachnospiraceae bacterium 29-84]
MKYKVTAVADHAFRNNKKLTRVTIGQNVKSIGSKVFYRNTRLKKVIIGKNVKSIGSHAFYKEGNLKNVTVYSKTLKRVGKNAFKGIHKKAYIDVPDRKAKAYKKLLKKAAPPKGVSIQ